eukprot:COSAG02_NODE_52927_length_305_cov_0.582524_1_plen_26_part_01
MPARAAGRSASSHYRIVLLDLASVQV